MDRFIPLSIPNFEGNEKKYVNDALDQGWVSTGGAYITKLERAMAAFLGVENTAACQSGTSALHLSPCGGRSKARRRGTRSAPDLHRRGESGEVPVRHASVHRLR
ncbi:MAG: DegT/DnrJ/EryC1/StrS family aminotransferase [Dysosmobacter sp.]